MLEKSMLNFPEDRVRAPVKEFERLILAQLAQQIVSSHMQAKHRTIVTRNPCVRGSQRTDKRRQRQGRRKLAVPVVTASRRRAR